MAGSSSIGFFTTVGLVFCKYMLSLVLERFCIGAEFHPVLSEVE